MDCQASDSKKLYKVFDASRRKKCRKKREGLDETNSLATDDSASLAQIKAISAMSTKVSLQDVSIAKGDGPPVCPTPKRDSSPSVPPSPVVEVHHAPRSPRRHRRQHREGKSLALKAGLTSTPRSASPLQDGEGLVEPSTPDQDSFIYAFLEEAIKKDKKRHRHSRRHEESRERARDHDRDRGRDRDHERERGHDCACDDRERDERPRDRDAERDHDHDRDRDRDQEPDRDRNRDRDRDDTVCSRDCRHHSRRRHRDRDRVPSRDKDRTNKDPHMNRFVDQAFLLETFAKLCTTINEKTAQNFPPAPVEMVRTQSHKSLQCEVIAQRDAYDVDQRPVRLVSRETEPHEPPAPPTRLPSKDNLHEQIRSRTRSTVRPHDEHRDRYARPNTPPYDRHTYHKLDAVASRARNLDVERYEEYNMPSPTRSCLDHTYRREAERREHRGYDDRREPIRDRRSFDDDKRKHCEHKMSRSFDIHREKYPEDDRYRRTSRSDSHKRRYDAWRDKRSCDPREMRKFYLDEKDRDPRDRPYNGNVKEMHSRRHIDRSERNSVASKDDREEFGRDRDRFSERERDSGLSVADCDNSTVSGKSNYLRVVKQEIAEQREAMDKMMKLWKELMRCFKGISQNQTSEKAMNESAANVQETAAAQLRLWRECMRRYETVARDVGDTDARLMEEITKQRSEIAEMANMWQECLQRYRDISSDFKSLKAKIKLEADSPVRQPAPAPAAVCAEGEGTNLVHAPYRLPPNYPPSMPQMPPMAGPSYPGGSPLRSRASVPPAAWWWCGEQANAAPPRAHRRSSPESRSRNNSRSRERRHHRHKDRDEPARYKDKPSKPSMARSEHRHRKR